MSDNDIAKREILSAKAILDECVRSSNFSLQHLDLMIDAVRALGVTVRRAKAEIKFNNGDIQGGLKECQEIIVRDPRNMYANFIMRKYNQTPQKV